MSEEEIILKAVEELKTPTLGVTEQYLEIYQVVSVGGTIKVDRVDTEDKEGVAVVYIPVVGELFHLAVYVDINKRSVTGVGTEPCNRVYFTATSQELSLDELKAITVLEPTKGWSKGDLKKNANLAYKFTSIQFRPNPEPDKFENKLKKLLDFLEQDTEGVRELVDKANGAIKVAIDFHNGNGMLGGMHIDSKSMQRMGKLNLAIDFDLYAAGNKFKE